MTSIASRSRNYGKTVAGGANAKADVNNDGNRVDIKGPHLRLRRRSESEFRRTYLHAQELPTLPFTAQEVQQWIRDAKAQGIDADGIATLEQLLTAVLQQANPT